MSSYTVYDATTGEVVLTGVTSDGTEGLFSGAGQDVYIGTELDRQTQYLPGGVPTQRPTVSAAIDNNSIQADGFDYTTITGIPAGWAYEVSNGETGTTAGGDIYVTALEAGSYTLKFTNWPYQDVEYVITASATPVEGAISLVGTPHFRLHSNPAVTLEEMKTAAKHEMHALDDVFLARELEFIGCSRATFDLKAAEAVTYYAAGYPAFDAETYPYLAIESEVTGLTPQQASDAILVLKKQYDATVATAERTRLSANNYIDLQGYVETVARYQFAWRHAFSLTAVPGAVLSKPFVVPAPDPNYETVLVAGDGVDTLTITLPEKPDNLDARVIVEAYAPQGDAWRGAYSQTYINPASPFALTFTDPTDPAYASSDIKWLVTIKSPPRIPQQFIVDSSTA